MRERETPSVPTEPPADPWTAGRTTGGGTPLEDDGDKPGPG